MSSNNSDPSPSKAASASSSTSALAEELKFLEGSIRSSKATERRASVEKLRLFVVRLKSESNLHLIARPTWSKCIASALIPALDEEVQQQMKNKNKNMRKYVTEPLSTIIKCLVECVDSEEKNGDVLKDGKHASSTGQDLLTKKALEALFEHIFNKFDDVNKRSYFTADYCDILRFIMYNRACSLKFDQKEILEWLRKLMSMITDSKHQISQPESKQFSHTVESILCKYPHDTYPIFEDILNLFSSYVNKKQQGNSFEATSLHMLTAMNAVVIKNVQDFIPLVQAFCEDSTPYFCDVWKETKSEPLRAEICLFFRIVMEARLSTDIRSVLNRDSIASIYQMVLHGLSETRLFSQAARTIGQKQIKKRRHHLKLFFDLSADIFFLTMSYKEETDFVQNDKDVEPQSKRRKLSSIFDRFLERIKARMNNDMVTINWQILLLHLVRRHKCSLPSNFLHSATEALVSWIQNQNCDKTSALEALELLAMNFDQSKDQDVMPFWLETILPIVSKFVTTEGTLALCALRVVRAILVHIAPSRVFSDDVSNILASKFFQDPHYCDETTLTFATTVLTLQRHQGTSSVSNVAPLLQWVFRYLHHPQYSSSDSVSSDSVSLFLDSIVQKIELAQVASVNPVSDDSKHGKYLAQFSLLSDPFKIRPTKQKESRDQKTFCCVDATLLSDILHQMASVVKSITEEEVSTMNQDVDCCLYLMTVIINLSGRWNGESGRNTRENLMRSFNVLLRYVSKNMKSTSPSWPTSLQLIESVVQGVDEHTFLYARDDWKLISRHISNFFENSFKDVASPISSQSDSLQSFDGDDDISDVNTSTVNFRFGSTLKNQVATERALKILSVIGKRCPALATIIYDELSSVLKHARMSILLKFEVILRCCEMNNIQICVDAFSHMPTAVQDPNSRSMIMNIVGVCAGLSRSYGNNSEVASLVEVCQKLLTNFKNLMDQNKLDYQERESYVLCIQKLLGVTQFEEDTENIVDALHDSNYFIRLNAGGIFGQISITPKLATELFRRTMAKVVLPLLKEKEFEKSRTALLAISFFALRNESLERNIVVYLVTFFTKFSGLSNFIQQILVYLSDNFGYESMLELLEENIKVIMYHWVRENGLDSFPFVLFGKTSIGQILHEYGAHIIPFAIEQGGMIEQIASMLNAQKRPRDLVVANFSSIFSYYYMLYLSNKETGSRMDNYVREILGSDFQRCLLGEMDNVLVDMVLLLTSNECGQQPFFDYSTVQTALLKLARQLNCDSIFSLLKQHKGRIQLMLYNVHEKIFTTHNQFSRIDGLKSLELLVDSLGATGLSVSSTLRYVIHIILEATQFPGLENVSCSLLFKVLQTVRTNEDREDTEVIASNIQTIVNYMVDLISSQGSSTSELPAYKVLEHLIIHDRELQRFMSHLDPTCLDRLGESKLRQIFLESRKVSFSEEISLFVTRSGAEGVLQLLHVLKQNERALSTESVPSEMMLRAISKLVRVCRGHYNTIDKTAAGECLGILSLSTSLLQAENEHYEYEFDTIKLEQWTNSEIREVAGKRVLKLLNSYLVDRCVHVVRVASETLRRILATEQGQASYSLLPDSLKLSLQPFITTLSSTQRPYSTGYVQFLAKTKYEVNYDVFSSDLFSTDQRTYDQWIMNIVNSLIRNCVEDHVLRMCADISLCKPEFAEKIFPFLIYDLSQSKHSAQVCEKLSMMINTHIVSNLSIDVRAIRVLLSTLHILYRNFLQSLTEKTINKTKYWLNLSSISVADAALRANAVHTAVFYTELYCEENQVLSTISTALTFEDCAPREQNLLLRAYQRINEPDGFDGVSRNYGINTFILKSEREGNYQQALSAYDALAADDALQNLKSKRGIVSSLKNLGYNQTSALLLRGEADSIDLQELRFEQAWRNSSWTETPTALTNVNAHFHQNIFYCLNSIKEGDEKSFTTAFAKGRGSIIHELASGIDISPALIKLQMLSDVNEAWTSRLTNPNVSRSPSVSKWLGLTGTRITDRSFQDVEPLLALRSVIIQLFEPNNPLHLIRMVRMARKDGQYSYAANIMNRLSSAPIFKDSASLWLIEQAKLLWARGEQDSAVNVANLLVSYLKEKNVRNTNDIARVNNMIGRWLLTSQSESSDIISSLLTDGLQMEDKSKAYQSLAKFYDTIHNNLMQVLQSEELKTRKDIIETNRTLVLDALRTSLAERNVQIDPTITTAEILQQLKKDRSIPSFVRGLGDSIVRDEAYIRNLDDSRKTLLQQTMDHLIKAAELGDKYDISIVFRLCSLWFSNADDLEVNKRMQRARELLPIYKFIPLVYQIASRISGRTTEFHKQVYQLMLRLCKAYPHHTLLQIFALSNGDRLSQVDHNNEHHSADTARITTAKELLAQIAKENGELIRQYRDLTESYIELAYIPVDKKNPQKRLSPNVNLMKINELRHVPVPTIELPVHTSQSSTSDYPYVVRFSEEISYAGGVNLPKIIRCIGSDGKRYKQLVKGKDDLRQDAVMEQLFSLVNTLLSSDKNTKKRNLRIRTYKVIPLSPTTGLLGWVENTIPMMTYLIGPDGRGGAHTKYRPKDKRHEECRAMIGASAQKSVKERITTFRKVCQQFKPVFHHFFTEKFATPTEWFAKRLNYTRSVAANSIVGYIIGLGDRHLHNILLDTKSAEVVHIDLGVAFDQGQLLPIPEGIPFRLTRDLIDGFGVTGVEGVFRNCSEHTMTVLRNNAELISLVIEVLIHDPLYKWSLSPEKLIRRQSEQPIEGFMGGINQKKNVSADARRALLRLNEKLKGFEEGQHLSVKGHVNKLIKTATSEQQLACLFQGWGAHL